MTPRTPRRLIALASLALVAAACGGDDDAPVPAAAETESTSEATGGDDSETTTVPTGNATPIGTKPTVEIPAQAPTDLVVTDLIVGSGPEAEAGDTVTVHYVGVRTEDGVEFDNSFDRGQPFPVVLGTGSVIQGWDEGLIGVQQGARRQLDIPASLAYGERGAGDVIRPDDAITFVVDVLAVDKPVPVTVPERADPSECPATDGSEAQQREFDAYPPFCIDVDAEYTAVIETNFGAVEIELFPQEAPLAVNNFVTLARYGYFDDTQCHRAIPGFVVQCGDPTATGTGGPGYRFPDELPGPGEYRVGSIAMANSGPDSNGSQFFVITGENGASLPPQYSLFGNVIDGLDTTVVDLDAVANPESNGVPPLEEIRIESVTVTGP